MVRLTLLYVRCECLLTFFLPARNTWYPTWKDQAQMEISGVRIYQQQGYNGCTNGKKYFNVKG